MPPNKAKAGAKGAKGAKAVPETWGVGGSGQGQARGQQGGLDHECGG